MIATAAERIERAVRRHGPFALCWSGGKDSLALELAANLAGVDESVLVVSLLEVPAFYVWSANVMPDHLTIVLRSNIDEAYLHRNPHLVFPNGPGASAWMGPCHHTGQRQYAAAHGRHLLLGRRTADGNQCGPLTEDGSREYETRGIVHASPLWDWPHSAVFAALHYYDVPLPPCYDWPRGYQVGTGPWPFRQGCPTRAHGWAEVWQIDPEIVERAAHIDLPDARRSFAALSRGDDPCAASA